MSRMNTKFATGDRVWVRWPDGSTRLETVRVFEGRYRVDVGVHRIVNGKAVFVPIEGLRVANP